MRKFTSKNNSSSGTSTIISLSLVLFVVGLLAFVLINTNKVSNKMKGKYCIYYNVEKHSDNIHNEIEHNKRAEFKNYLENTPYFKKVTFNHKDSAFSELKKDLGEDFSSVLESNPLLDSYDAYVKAKFVSSRGLEEIEEFIHNYKGSSVVQDIFYQKNLVEKLNENVKKVSLFFCFLYNIFSNFLCSN